MPGTATYYDEPIPGRIYVKHAPDGAWSLVQKWPALAVRAIRFEPTPSPIELTLPWLSEYPLYGYRAYVVPTIVNVQVVRGDMDDAPNSASGYYAGGGLSIHSYTDGFAGFSRIGQAKMGVVEIDFGKTMAFVLAVHVYGDVLYVQE